MDFSKVIAKTLISLISVIVFLVLGILIGFLPVGVITVTVIAYLYTKKKSKNGEAEKKDTEA